MRSCPDTDIDPIAASHVYLQVRYVSKLDWR